MSSLAGRHLRVAITSLPPFTIRNDAIDTALSNADEEWSGTSIDLLRFVAQLGQFTYELHEAETFGQSDQNGQWNGMIGMLQRDEVDLAVSVITNTPERRRVVDFCVPLAINSYSVIVADDVEAEASLGDALVGIFGEWSKAFEVYPWQALLVMMAVAALVCLCSFAMEKIMHSPTGLVHIIGCTYRLYINQARDSFELARTQSAKSLLLSWALVCTILIALYPAALVAIFSVPPKWQPPFGSILQMDALGYRLIVANQTAQHEFLERIASDRSSAKGAAMRRILTPLPYATHLEALRLPRTAAYVGTEDFAECHGRQVPLGQDTDMYPKAFNVPFAFPKRSPLTRLFDPLVEQLSDAGKVDNLVKRIGLWRYERVIKVEGCGARLAQRQSGGKRTRASRLPLRDVVSPLVILAVCLVGACVLLLAECIVSVV